MENQEFQTWPTITLCRNLRQINPTLHYMFCNEIEPYVGNFQNMSAHPLNTCYPTISEMLRMSFDWSQSKYGFELWKAATTTIEFQELAGFIQIKTTRKTANCTKSVREWLKMTSERYPTTTYTIRQAIKTTCKINQMNRAYFGNKQQTTSIASFVLDCLDWNLFDPAEMQHIYMKLLFWELLYVNSAAEFYISRFEE